MEEPGLEAVREPSTAAAATAPVVADFRPKTVVRRRRSRRAGYVRILVPVLIIVLLLSGGAVSAFAGQRDLRSVEARVVSEFKTGQSDLVRGGSELKTAATNRDPALADQAIVDFNSGSKHFSAAASILDRDPWVKAALRVPIAADYLRPRKTAVDQLSAMGVSLADVAVESVTIEKILILPPDKSTGLSTSAAMVASLQKAQPLLDDIHTKLQRVQALVQAIDPKVLPASAVQSLDTAKAKIDKDLGEVALLAAFIPTLFEVMGVNGLRHYLILQVNPAELRAGGGFAGTYSLISADKGAVKLLTSGNSNALDTNNRPARGRPAFIEPPAAIIPLSGDVSWILGDASFFPDFPTNAKSAEMLVGTRLGSRPDGVISIDFFTVNELLKLTGPIPLPADRLTIDANNFIPEVLKGDLAGTNASHKAFIEHLSAPLMERLMNLPPASLPKLVGTLNQLAASRHLQVYFNEPASETQFDKFGFTGQVNTAKSNDFLMEVESNLGATKSNYFITRTYNMTLTVAGNVLHHQVDVTIDNKTPFQYNTHYNCYLRVLLAGTATSASLTGMDVGPARPTPPPAPPAGLSQLSGWLVADSKVNRGVKRITITYDTTWTPDSSGTQRLYWQKQPGTTSDSIAVTFSDAGNSFSATGDLGVDRVLTLSSTGVKIEPGQVGTAALPSFGG